MHKVFFQRFNKWTIYFDDQALLYNYYKDQNIKLKNNEIKIFTIRKPSEKKNKYCFGDENIFGLKNTGKVIINIVCRKEVFERERDI